MTRFAIRADGLTRTFGAFRAVDGLSFEIPPGTVFGFLGPNGAGKTTTIRLLLGLLEPTAGRAEIFGLDTRTRSDEIRRRTGVLLEHAGLYERLTAEQNLEFAARARDMPATERRLRIEESLARIGLLERRHEAVRGWSRGMKQKLAIARAGLHRPPLIFLDEPTAGLDPEAAAILRDDLASLAARDGITIFLTTHNMAEAERLCGLVGVIRGGRLLTVDHPHELRLRGAGQRAEIVGSNVTAAMVALVAALPGVLDARVDGARVVADLESDARLAPIVRLLIEAGAEVEEVRRDGGTLEAAFLALMAEAGGA
jgi:ABC-2 type transport system ATP-binding protein